MNIYRLIASSFLIIGMSIHVNQACVIALENNSNKQILVVTDDFKEGMIVPAGKSIEFGSKAYMANFRIMKQNGTKFTEQYHLQQTACTPNKYTQLKVSEITHNNSNIPFTVSQSRSGQKKKAQSGCGCGK